MIYNSPHLPPAEYDDEGNIILPSADENETKEEIPMWTITEEDSSSINDIEVSQGRVSRNMHNNNTNNENINSDESINIKNETNHILQNARENLFFVTKNVFTEGIDQYKCSLKECKNGTVKFLSFIISGRKNIWSFLSQPVWVVHRKKKTMKEYSRFSLFLIDSVRFGGTFAILFLFLFISLNYQSYWKIGKSYLHPLERLQQSSGNNSIDVLLKEKLLKSPSLSIAGNSEVNLLQFLPPVGPPDNRIVIPKLELNIPLVTPSYESLLNEDWNQLEEDIQEALQSGVVHYPGTAKPGQAGNFFVTGHSSYYPWAPGKYKNVFARLHDLNVGDEYWVYYGGDKHRYIVESKNEVKPSNVDVLDQPIDKRIATLMTCTPVGTTLKRLIIKSQEVDPITGLPMSVGQHESLPQQKIQLEALPI